MANEKNIFDFDSITPPKITESMLRAEAKRRELKIQSTVLTIGAFLMAAAVIVLGIFFLRYSEAMAVVLFITAVYTVLGAGGIMYVFLCRGTQIMSKRKTYVLKGE